MYSSQGFLIISLLLHGQNAWASINRLHDRIYKPIKSGAYFCFRQANGTHQFGCSSDLNGNVGVLHLIQAVEDLVWIKQHGHSNSDYVAMVTPEMFTFDHLKDIEDAGMFSGVVLIKSVKAESLMGEKGDRDRHAPSAGFSSDAKCPNAPSSGYKTGECEERNSWNPAGSDIGRHEWPFPIIYITDANTTKELVEDCYEKYNKPEEDGSPRHWPLCAVELDSFMNQAVNSEVCMRRQDWANPFSPSRWCDPLGDQSVFMMLTPPETSDSNTQPSDRKKTDQKEYPENSIILVSARLDQMGMFDNTQVGSESPATGIVTLLSVIKLLSDHQRPETRLAYRNGVENVLFAFLNGESYDYIGSSKMVYDMGNSEFPCVSSSGNATSCKRAKDKVKEMVEGKRWPSILPKSIRNYLEVGQVYSRDKKGSDQDLYIHVDSSTGSDTLVGDLKASFRKAEGLRVATASDAARELPPSSVRKFLGLTAPKKTPSALLTNFDQSMTNKYYHSLYDDYVDAKVYDPKADETQDLVVKISRVAESVASHVFYQATGARTVFEMDQVTVKNLLDCFINTSRCDLFAKASTPNLPPQFGRRRPEGPYPQYVQVVSSHNMHPIFVQRVLAYLSGDNATNHTDWGSCNADEDQNIYRYFWLRGNDDDPECNMDPKGSMTNGTRICGICQRSTSWLSYASSPAFAIDDYDFKNETYSTWTESQWTIFSGRIFLKQSPGLDQGFLATGIIVFLFSLFFVFWGNNYSAEIFPMSVSSATETHPTQDPRRQSNTIAGQLEVPEGSNERPTHSNAVVT